jgi:cell division protein FtsZ
MKMPDTSERLFHVPGVQPRCRTVVMGVGGAGCNSVAHMSALWQEGPEVVALNTDTQALAACMAPRSLQIGPKATQGLGASGDAQAGRLAAEESMPAIQEILGGADLLFLVAGLGGGTGTGATPAIVQAARRHGVLTLCFATMPFRFEGDRRRRQAEEGLRTLQKLADAVICLPNDRLSALLEPGTALEDAFRKSDEITAAVVHNLWSLLSRAGVINLDFADVRQLAEHSGGSCGIGLAEGSGPARCAMALRALMESPLLDKGRLLKEAQGILVNIVGGPDLTLADVQGIMGQISSSARQEVHLFVGAMIEPGMRDRLSLTVLVTENWLAPAVPTAQEAPSEPPAGMPDKLATGVPAAETADRRDRGKDAQGRLNFDPVDRGRFRNVEPTIKEGEDLDVPTYVRRGVRLSFER